MGRSKALMMEIEEAQWKESSVSFHCPNCNAKVEGFVDLPVVYEEGDEVNLPVEVSCSICSASFGGWLVTDWHRCDIALDDYPDTSVTANPARGFIDEYERYDDAYFDWLGSQDLSSRPLLRAFTGTMSDVKALSLGLSADPKSQMLARMLLSQSITALEVFLSDTLILAVKQSGALQEKLLRSKSLQIGSRDFKLSDAVGVENFAREKLLDYLRAVSFHNLEKVSTLYRIGLGIEIIPDGEDAKEIDLAIKIRHDCVHRNGKDQATGDLRNIPQVSLLQLIESLRRMVNSIDLKVRTFEEQQEKLREIAERRAEIEDYI